MTLQISENIWQFTNGGNVFLAKLNNTELILVDGWLMCDWRTADAGFRWGIKAIHVPGHTEDNFAYWWEREKVLFVADLLHRRSGSLELTNKRITWNVSDSPLKQGSSVKRCAHHTREATQALTRVRGSTSN
ncbi:MAG: hypothetical protein L0154_25205 [Chloroflexi bacterium]|nr:hypothetical protein [Chloroflexota bacterium]